MKWPWVLKLHKLCRLCLFHLHATFYLHMQENVTLAVILFPFSLPTLVLLFHFQTLRQPLVAWSNLEWTAITEEHTRGNHKHTGLAEPVPAPVTPSPLLLQRTTHSFQIQKLTVNVSRKVVCVKSRAGLSPYSNHSPCATVDLATAPLKLLSGCP